MQAIDNDYGYRAYTSYLCLHVFAVSESHACILSCCCKIVQLSCQVGVSEEQVAG